MHVAVRVITLLYNTPVHSLSYGCMSVVFMLYGHDIIKLKCHFVSCCGWLSSCSDTGLCTDQHCILWLLSGNEDRILKFVSTALRP